MQRKVLKTSNAAYAMLLAQGQISEKIGLFRCLLAVLSSQGIVVKCTAAIFFRMVDLRRNGTGRHFKRSCTGQRPQLRIILWWWITTATLFVDRVT